MKENKLVPGDPARVDIKAVPGASRTELAGFQNGRLRVRIAGAPEGGKANGELIAFFSRLLGCPKRVIVLERGEKSRQKTLAFPSSYKAKFDEIVQGQEKHEPLFR
ncbi:MAG: DUF167 domain-containing protein [Treponema sp.]|jgi:uncharacterized protein (TIGR00251 family)|nr:DUF167 domain-containing protein [Treponema sp.]